MRRPGGGARSRVERLTYGAALAAAVVAPTSTFAFEAGLRGQTDVAVDVPATCVEGSGGCVTLLGVRFDGVTAFDAADFAPLYEPLLSRSVSAQDLARVAQQVTDRYRDEGYFLTRAFVPHQDGSGIARIAVSEGHIAELRLEGDGAEQARPFLRGVEDAPIANLSDLERRLALAGDVPGLRLRTRMEPIAGDPNGHRLVITADLAPISADMFADNRGSNEVPELRIYGRIAANSAFSERDQIGVAVFTAPESTSAFALGEISYAYAFESGGRLRVSFAQSRIHDGADMVSTDVGGDTQNASLSYEFPLLRNRRTGLWLGAGFDALHQGNDWADGSGAFEDELRVTRVALRGLLGENGRSTSMVVQASFGLDMLGASGPSPTRRSRSDADANFAKLDVFVSHYRDLGRYFGLYTAFAGQWSPEPLLGAEEFTAGGARFGRAYGYGEISGDRGLAGSAELRAGFDPAGDIVSFVQGYVFVDAAEVWNVEAGSQSLASAGAGLRLRVDDWLTAGWELARPLTRTPSDVDDNDWRQFFSVSAAY